MTRKTNRLFSQTVGVRGEFLPESALFLGRFLGQFLLMDSLGSD